MNRKLLNERMSKLAEEIRPIEARYPEFEVIIIEGNLTIKELLKGLKLKK